MSGSRSAAMNRLQSSWPAAVHGHADAVPQRAQHDDHLGVLVASSRSRRTIPDLAPLRTRSRSSFRAMFATTWMCTQEWSLMRMRRTALTFATCHQARSETSALARATTSRRIRLRRAGMLIRIAATASAGRHRRAALGLDGDAALAGGRRLDLLVVRHGAYRTRGADDAPDVACALPAAQVLVAQAARPGGRADRRGDRARRPRARPVLRVRRRADRGGGARPPGDRHRRQPVRDLPGARPPRRPAIRTRSPPPARGCWRRRRARRGAWHRHALPALRRRGGAGRYGAAGSRDRGRPRALPAVRRHAPRGAAAGRPAAGRAGRTAGGDGDAPRPPVFAGWQTRKLVRAGAATTSASCSRPATCARSRRCGRAILAEPDDGDPRLPAAGAHRARWRRARG